MKHIFYDGWEPLVRTLIVGFLAYTALVICLRVSGKRTLSKMNAFDFIVTIALGSTLATMLMSKDSALAQGVLAFVLLIGLQFLVTFLSVRSPSVRRFVTGEPQLLFFDGEFLLAALRQTRVTQAEVLAAVRAAGISDLDGVRAVVLETDASFSVVKAGGRDSTLSNVKRSAAS